MRVPFSWLSKYIDIQSSAEKISDILTDLGIEVDAIEEVGSGFSGVVVGEVVSAQKHPDADKLTVAQVSNGADTVQVVCAAANCRAGIKVAFAQVGAKVGEMKIGKAKLRGVESFGMLCAADELGLEKKSEGIIELAKDAPLGEDLSKLFYDTIFEISLTPNLGHASSVLGIARELSAATGLPVRMPHIQVSEGDDPIAIKVLVKDPAKCPRYACRVVKGVTVAPSPDWMQKQLIASGLRPINNIVDITNYVLLELGHPLHAFDLSQVKEIVVRSALDKEAFETLDGKTRTLSKDDLLITDGARGIAIAGVMGGANSEVKETTKDVLIESAYFEPTTIRRTSQRLGLQTDSSKRFERGVDPNMVTVALDRAASLMQEIAGGTIAKGMIDQKSGPFEKWNIALRVSKVQGLLGIPLSMGEVESSLKKLGMEVTSDGTDLLNVSVPTYRSDVKIEEDLIEEVARLYGYNNITKSAAAYRTSIMPHSPIYLFEKEMRERLCREGLQEFLTCDLISPHSLALLQEGEMPQESIIRVLNPTSEEQSVLRTSLLPGMLSVIKYNQDHQTHDVSGFEIGRVYYKTKEGYGEQPVAGIVLAGKVRPHVWESEDEEVNFYDLKGILENLFDQLNIKEYAFEKSAFSTLHTGRQASVYIGKLEVASLGEVHPSILRQLGITKRVLFCEINLQELMQIRVAFEKMKPLSKYPGSERDWTITLEENVPVGDVLKQIEKNRSGVLEGFSLISLYRSEKLGANKKNATFRFNYRDLDKTISQETVEKEHAQIVDAITRTLKL